MRTSSQGKNNPYGWYIAILSALFGCVLTAGYPQFSLTLPQLAEQTGISQEALLSGDTVKLMAVVLAMWLSDPCRRRFGLYPTILLGSGFTVIPQFLLPWVGSLPLFLVLKFLQGLSSIVFPVMMLLMMEWVEERQTGLVTAAFNGIFYGGGGIGATAASLVLQKWGWIASYYALGIALATVTALWLLTVRQREDPAPVKEHKSETGAALPKLLRQPKVWCLILGFVPTTFAVQAISSDLALYGSFLGYSERQIGGVGSAVTVGMVAACLASGRCSDFFAGKQKVPGRARVAVLLAGCLLTVASALGLLAVAGRSISCFQAAALLFSFGGSWGLGVFYSILPDVFDADILPAATGFLGGCGDMMMPIAPTVVGVFCGIRGLWSLGWGTCAVLAALGAAACVLLLILLRQEQRNESSE